MLMNIAMGRLTRDPELRMVNIGGNQVPVCEFAIAVNTGFGENQQTEFINCVAWRNKAENINKFFTKGRNILVNGKQKTSKYKDSNGVDRYKTEWVIDEFFFCDSANSNNNNNSQGAQGGTYQQPAQNQPSAQTEAAYMASNQFYQMAQSQNGDASNGQAPF